MGLTSAQSGENYRNWWPHPVMREFTDLSTGLMEAIARATGNRIRLTRRGYVLVTRDPAPAGLLAELEAGYAGAGAGLIRLHEGAGAAYRPGDDAGWEAAPDGVDVLLGQALVRRHFPHLAPDAAAIPATSGVPATERPGATASTCWRRCAKPAGGCGARA